MSIKTKAPLLVMSMLLINAVALICFILMFLPDHLIRLVEHYGGSRITVETLLRNRFVLTVLLLELVAYFTFAAISALLVYLSFVKPLISLNKSIAGNKVVAPIARTNRRDEIGQLQNSFVEMMEQLQQEKQNQDRMMAGISHDIKTPLTSIEGYSETLKRKEVTKEQANRYLEAIYVSAQRIEQIVEEFDQYVEGRQPSSLEKKEYSLAFLAEMLREEYEQELRIRGMKLLVNNDSPAGSTLRCDLPKIRRVFANLVGNALKHNQNAKDFAVEINLRSEADEIVFEVRDNGCGVTADDLPHVFEPFFSTRTDSRSGLGLSICKDIVEAHGGLVQACNAAGGGFEVRFALPVS